jgi:small GTP-binding protein
MRSAQAGGRVVRAEKIVLIGAASSGKTSLVNRFAHDRFQPNSEATIGAAFISKTVTVGNADIKLEIWDTGGTEKYKSLAPMYYRDARAAVIVFDVTSQQSFTEAAEWLSEFRERGQPTAIVVAAANKVDLESHRRITKSVATDFAFQNQLEFIKETSALSGHGVKELFTDLAKQLLGLPPMEGCNVAVNEDLPRYGGNPSGSCAC